MKKALNLFAVMILVVLFSLNTVHASDLTGQLKFSSILGEGIKYDLSYDEEADMNNVLVTLLVDENSINTILGQRPGVGSTLSTFYFGINPKLSTAKTINEQVWVGENLTHKTFESAMTTLESKLDTGSIDDEQIVWGTTLTIQYSKDGGQTWSESTGAGNGSTSIGENLLKHLELSDDSKLEYGKNFRFSMYTDYTFILGWNKLDASNQSLGKEYVSVEWEIEFPITGQIDERAVFFTKLEDALASGSEDITINKDVVVDSDVVIPEGVVINVANGATLEVKEGNSFENNGKVYGDVKVDGDIKTYSSIVINPIKNGDVKVNTIVAANGDLVTITPKAKEGYKLKSITVLDFGGNEIEVKDGKFKMPAGPVEVFAEFEIEVPNTVDNIMLYVGIAFISLAIVVVTTKQLKKATVK